jgi:transposase
MDVSGGILASLIIMKAMQTVTAVLGRKTLHWMFTSITPWLESLPGVGKILAVVAWTEIDSIERFNRAEQLASYSGLVAREHSSGGKFHYGAVRHDVNVYLKWAFVEAAGSAIQNRQRCGYKHIGQLYERIKARRGHNRAKVAVARHLAEASFWMLKKGEPYREPRLSTQR